MSPETELPVIMNSTLKDFAGKVPVQTVVSVRTGRFAVPIPNLDDGGEPLLLPNAKELRAIVRSGKLGTSITSSTAEGMPQKVPTDGSDVVVINNISKRQAAAMKAIYKEIIDEHRGVTREALVEFFGAVTGITYDSATNQIKPVEDNIGIHGDLFNMNMNTFKERHRFFTSDLELKHVRDDEIKAGFFEKKRDTYKAYAISGGFTRLAESGSELQYPETAMIAVGRDGKVSAIHANDISVSYETEDGKLLIGEDKKLQLPTYPVGQVLLEQRGAPKRPQTRVVGEE